jgi:geranylgeranyl pyrophosphate synthase
LESLRQTALGPMLEDLSPSFIGGKMLRGRLTLLVGSACQTDRTALLQAAAAIEMTHAASLLHDDVVDDALVRRGVPALWRKKGVAGAILLGDLLVCHAMQLVHAIRQRPLGTVLVTLSAEMCNAEVEQELVARETTSTCEKSISIARRKTGSLFAFAATAAELQDEARAAALLEAGYRLGTAYQLADDILDASGKGVADGKDLGKDAKKRKVTAMTAKDWTPQAARQCIEECCRSSLELLAPWPEVQGALREYLQAHFGPVVAMFTADAEEAGGSPA